MATTTVLDLIARAKTAADKTNSNHVSETEYVRQLNVDLPVLASMIARHGYVLKMGREDIAADGSLQYEIADPIAILGVYELDSGRYRRLQHSDIYDGAGFIDNVTTGPATMFGVTQNSGDQTTIKFWPIPDSGTYQVFTIDLPAVVTAASSITYPAGFDEWLVLRLAIFALSKEESSTGHLERRLEKVEKYIEAFAWDRVMAGHQQIRNVDRVERGWSRFPYIPSRDFWYFI